MTAVDLRLSFVQSMRPRGGSEGVQVDKLKLQVEGCLRKRVDEDLQSRRRLTAYHMRDLGLVLMTALLRFQHFV
jgi:hypothetical protein